MRKERRVKESDWNRFHQFVQDCALLNTPVMRSFGAIHYVDPMDDTFEYRYEQRTGEYLLRCWHNGTEKSHRGPVDNTPEWLRAILDTAKVAGALRQIDAPPPEAILWFRTDEHHNLIEFIEMK